MRFRTFVAVAAAGMALAFLPTTAHAQPDPRHCVIDLGTKSVSCYATFTEAISAATGGRVTTVPDDVTKVQDDPALKAYVAGQVAANCPGKDGCILSIEHEDDDYDDSSLTARGPYTCSGPVTDIDYELPVMPPGWNDQIGSFLASTDFGEPSIRGLCYVQHFEHHYFQGGWIGPSGSQSQMGGMDDETSSIRWT